MHAWLWFAIAILCLVLVPFAPQLVRLRIRFLRWLAGFKGSSQHVLAGVRVAVR